MKWKEIKSDIRERGHVNLIFFHFPADQKKKRERGHEKIRFFCGSATKDGRTIGF